MHEEDKAYFVTLTIVNWIDVFTQKNHKLVIVDSLKYCQANKGLEIFAWCLMPSHIHLIVRSIGKHKIYEILRDFKKFTSRKIIHQITEDPESRREWLLNQFEYAGRHLKAIKNYKLWQSGNHAEVIYSPAFFYNKLHYIHKNPVVDMIVDKEEDYLFSSARNYAERSSLIEIILESQQLITY
jgi:REP element-mobilizing transposase RayT